MFKGLKYFLGFEGRVNRWLYLALHIPIILVSQVYFPLQYIILTGPHTSVQKTALVVFGILFWWLVFSVVIRRLHDLNARAGWSLLILSGVFLHLAPPVAHFIMLLTSVSTTLVLVFMPGTKTGNRFGPPPPGIKQCRAQLQLKWLEQRYAAGKKDAGTFNKQRQQLLNIIQTD